MEKKTVRMIVVAAWIAPLAFLLGMGWGVNTVRVSPSRETIHEVRDQVAAYYGQHGSFPPSLEFLPSSTKEDVERFRVTYDPEKLELSSEAGPYYSYSFLYVLTRGLLGRRSLYYNPGFDLTHIRE